MAQEQPFFTGADPEGFLYLMPQDTIREAVYDPAGLDGPDIPSMKEDAPASSGDGKQGKVPDK